MHAFDKINDEMWLTLLWSWGLMSPWRVKFLMCRTIPDEQVPGGLVHMGRWLVQTSMLLKSPSDGCWDPIRGRDRTMIGRAFAQEKKENVFIQDTLAEPSPRGLTYFRWKVFLLMARTSPRRPWRHLERVAVWWDYWHVWQIKGALKGLTPDFWMLDMPKRGQRLP